MGFEQGTIEYLTLQSLKTHHFFKYGKKEFESNQHLPIWYDENVIPKKT